jgi:ribosomal protein L36
MESPRSQTSPLPTGNFPKISLQKPQYKRKANYHRRHMSTDKKNGVAHIRSLDEVTHSKAARASTALSPQQWGSMRSTRLQLVRPRRQPCFNAKRTLKPRCPLRDIVRRRRRARVILPPNFLTGYIPHITASKVIPFTALLISLV